MNSFFSPKKHAKFATDEKWFIWVIHPSDDGNVTSSVEHFYPDPLMCRLLDIPAPTSDSKSDPCQAKIVFKSEIQTFIYQSIRDSQANNVNTSMLEGAFEGLEHEASAAFEDLAPGLVIISIYEQI